MTEDSDNSQTVSIWTFRLVIAVIAYATVAMCNFLLMPSTSPFLDAIPPAVGIVIGFAVLRLVVPSFPRR